MNLQERMALVGRIEALEQRGDLAARVEAWKRRCARPMARSLG